MELETKRSVDGKFGRHRYFGKLMHFTDFFLFSFFLEKHVPPLSSPDVKLLGLETDSQRPEEKIQVVIPERIHR